MVTSTGVADVPGVSPELIVAAFLFEGVPVAAAGACLTLGGTALVRRLAKDASMPRSLVVVTGAGVGVGIFLTSCLLLGIAGLLSAGVVLTLLGTSGVAGVLLLRRETAWWRREATRPPWWAWPPLVAALAVTLTAALLPPGFLWGGEPNAYDVLSYHLQIPREWHDVGRIVPLDHNVFSRMPLGNEVLFLAAMHAYGGAYEATFAPHFINVGLGVAFAATCYAAVRGTGGSTASAGVAAVAAACVPWTVMLSSMAYNEPLYLLAAALVLAWLMRGNAFAAGVFAGLGLAAKYTALPMSGGAGLLALLATSGKASVRNVLLFAMGLAVFALPWVVRNVAWYGEPVSPLVGDVGGWETQQVDRFRAAHDAAWADAPGALWNELLANGRFGYVLVPLGVAAAVVLLRRRESRRAGVVVGAMMVVAVVVWVSATHQVGRFLVVLIPPSAVAVGLAFRGRMRFAAAYVVAGAGLTYTLVLHEGRGLVGVLVNAAPALGVGGGPAWIGPDLPETAGVWLVGDAKAFVYDVPRVRYKVVFDVPPAPDAVAAWLGPDFLEAPDSDIVVIDRGELGRLARTYGTPTLHPADADLPAVVRAGELRQHLRRTR